MFKNMIVFLMINFGVNFFMSTTLLWAQSSTQRDFFTQKTFSVDSHYKGFVSIPNKDLYVDYIAPQKNKPTVILLNGLTYSTVQWTAMTLFLQSKGFGVLRYDMDGMGLTLLKYGVKLSPYSLSDQVDDLQQLLQTLRIPKPYNLVGLSYGGGVASAYAVKYPQLIGKLVLMAPYTEALEQQDNYIKQQIYITRLYNQNLPVTNDQLYDFYLRQICYTTYPIAEPIVLENPFKLEAVFRMTQGIRKFVVSESAHLFPARSVYLVIAENDQYIPRDVLEKFWDKIPVAAKVEKFYLPNSEHKIPEARPKAAADLVEKILTTP